MKLKHQCLLHRLLYLPCIESGPRRLHGLGNHKLYKKINPKIDITTMFMNKFC